MERRDGMGFLFDFDAVIYGLNVETVSFYVDGGTISDTKSANYNSTDILGRSATIFGYTNSPSRTLSFTALLVAETDPKRDVVDKVRFLKSFVYPDYSSLRGTPRPPHRVHFSYGKEIAIVGIIQSCDVTWETMLSNGLNRKFEKAVEWRDVNGVQHREMQRNFDAAQDLLPMKATVSLSIQEVRESFPLDCYTIRTRGDGVWEGTYGTGDPVTDNLPRRQ